MKPSSTLVARLVALAGLVAGCLSVTPATAASWPALDEVANRLRALRPDLPEPPPGDTDVEAYLGRLAPRVISAPISETSNVSPVMVTVFDAGVSVACLRPGEVRASLRSELDAALKELQRTNPPAGLVLDLRRSSGTDLAAAVSAAGALVTQPIRGVRCGGRDFDAEPSPGRPPLPVMVLVGSGTRGGAELLAALLRSSASPCLLIGGRTAGYRWEYREAVLAPGAAVWVAGAPVLMSGDKPLPDGGLVPDLAVSVDPRDEEAYLADPFARRSNGAPAPASIRPRLNEAELVRRRFGPNGHPALPPGRDEDEPGRRPVRLRPDLPHPPAAPTPVLDPALARALDLMAGVAGSATPAGVSR